MKTPWIVFGKNIDEKRPLLRCEHCCETHTIAIPEEGIASDAISTHVRHFTALHRECRPESFAWCLRCHRGITRAEWEVYESLVDDGFRRRVSRQCPSCAGDLVQNVPSVPEASDE
jgi:hypothetical protein